MRAAALFGLAGLLAPSLLICGSEPQSELLLPSSRRPLPEWLAGPLHGIGANLGLFARIAVFLALFASYAVAAGMAHRLSRRASAAARCRCFQLSKAPRENAGRTAWSAS
jgi:hypothetical protein